MNTTNRRLLILTVVLAVVSLYGRFSLQTPAVYAEPQADCSIGHTDLPRHQNHVDFEVAWHGGDEDHYPWTFGDEAGLVLTGTEGTRAFGHDYGYIVGGIITYTAGFTFTGGTMVDFFCHTEIVIDDSPDEPPTPHKIYMPVVSNQPGPPIATLTIVEIGTGSTWNQVKVRLVWDAQASDTGSGTLDWGDPLAGPVHLGSRGDEEFSHDYPWPGGDFTITLSVTGPGGTTIIPHIIHLVAP